MKFAVGKVPGEEKYEHLLHEVWGTMAKLQGGAYGGFRSSFNGDKWYDSVYGHAPVIKTLQERLPLGESWLGSPLDDIEPPSHAVTSDGSLEELVERAERAVRKRERKHEARLWESDVV